MNMGVDGAWWCPWSSKPVSGAAIPSLVSSILTHSRQRNAFAGYRVLTKG